jgi:hypothetical protein
MYRKDCYFINMHIINKLRTKFCFLSLRHVESQEATAIGQILQDQILAGFFLFWGIVKTSAEKALKQVAEYPNRYLKTLHPIR